TSLTRGGSQTPLSGSMLKGRASITSYRQRISRHLLLRPLRRLHLRSASPRPRVAQLPPAHPQEPPPPGPPRGSFCPTAPKRASSLHLLTASSPDGTTSWARRAPWHRWPLTTAQRARCIPIWLW